MFDRLASRLDYLHGDVTDSELYDRWPSSSVRTTVRCTTWKCRPPCSRRSSRTSAKVGLLERHASRWRSRSATTWTPRANSTTGCMRCWMKTRSCGWTTSWASNPSSSWSICGSPTTALAELWDRGSISEIHITMAEDFGVEDRGKFYDAVGALRDVVQNHLLQVLALVAMEPPVGASADDLNDKKAEVFRAMPALDPAALRARSVSGLYRRRRGGERIRRPRPSSRCGPRSTTGAGPGCRSSCAPARRCRTR